MQEPELLESVRQQSASLPEAVALEVVDPETKAMRDALAKQALKTGFNWKRAGLFSIAAVMSFGILGFSAFAIRANQKSEVTESKATYAVSSVPLSGITSESVLGLAQIGQLDLNGIVKVNGALVLTPSTQPQDAQAGQIYFDKTSGSVLYYTGTEFREVSTTGNTVKSINGITGDIRLGPSLTLANGVLGANIPPQTAIAVTSVQGQTGDVLFTAGAGISLSGIAITNTGVTSFAGQTGNLTVGRGLAVSAGVLSSTSVISSGSANIIITDNGNGNYTIADSGVGGAGNVALGPVSPQTDNTTNPSISIDKTGAGDLLNLLVNGSTTFRVNSSGLIVNGSIDYSQVNNRPASTVTSVGGASGAIVVGSGLTLVGNTLSNDGVTTFGGSTGAITVGTGLSLAANNLTNTGVTSLTGTPNQVTVSGATGNITLTLPQSIATTSSPTFAALTLSSALSVGNGGTGATTAAGARTNLGAAAAGANSDITSLTGLTVINPSAALTIGSTTQNLILQGNASTTLTATSGAFTSTLAFAAPTANQTITIPNASGTICLSSGNCPSTGVGGGGTVNTIPLFNGATSLADSIISQNGLGNTITITGDLSVTSNLSATNLSGNGSGLTSLSATNVSSGTLNDTRLSANVTLQGNSFNGPSQLVQLNVSGQLPAVSGALVTNISASNVTSGTLADARLSANVTLQGNSFNGVSQLVQTNASGELPVLSGTNLTNLNASALTSGTVNDARLSANVTVQGNTFNGANQLVQLNGSGQLPAVSGINLTNLNGSAITTGTVGVGVGGTGATTAAGARTNLGAAASGANSDITSLTGLTVINPSASLTIGNTGQALTLQGSATTSLTATSGAFTSALVFQSPSVNATITVPNATGTICLSTGNCLGGPGGGANTALSNLASVSLNTSLLPGSSTIDLGSNSSPFQDLYIGGAATTNFKFTGVATAARTITVPDASGTLCLSTGNCAGAGSGITGSGTTNTLAVFSAGQNIVDSIISQNAGATIATVTGDLSVTGAITGNGSGLTSLNGSNISTGTVADTRLSSNVTLQGNTFNGNSQLVQINGSGQLPAVSGALLTTLNASNLTSGTVADARLTSNVTLAGNAFNGANQLVQLTASGFMPALNGAALTSLNATNITSGIVAVGVGGTGITSYTTGDLIYASGTTTLAKLAAPAAGQCLVSNGVGVAPSWGSCLAGGGIGAVGALDSQSKSADGAVISGSTIYFQTADASNVGLVSNTSQTFGGAKTFNSLITGQAGLNVTGATINLNASSNFGTNINTGTSTGAVNIGNSATQGINITTSNSTPFTLTSYGSTLYTDSYGFFASMGGHNTIYGGCFGVCGGYFYGSIGSTSLGAFGSNISGIVDGGSVTFSTATNTTTGFRVQNSTSTSIFNIDTTNSAVQVAGLLDNTLATPLNIGTTNATQINLNKNTQVTGNITFANGANRTITLATPGTLNTSGNELSVFGATANGTGAGGALRIVGGEAPDTGAGGSVYIYGGGSDTGSAGSVNIDAGQAGSAFNPGNINIGTIAGGGTINMGNISDGMGVNILNAGTINLGTGAVGTILNLGTGAGIKTISIGTTNTSSTTNIFAGSGGINLTGTTKIAILSTAGIVTNTAAGVLGTVAAVPVSNGGTGLTSYATGDLLYASGSGTIAKLAAVATGQCLVSQGVGVAPAYGSCAVGSTLQGAYTGSTGGTTPEIVLDSTRTSVDIQDRSSSNGGSLGTSIFNIRATAANDSTLGASLFSVGSTGAVILQNSVNSTTALQVLNASGTSVLSVDTTNSLATLKSIGGSATVGAELLNQTPPNNNFNNATYWTLGSGWGSATATSVTATSAGTSLTATGSNLTFTNGKTYQIEFTVGSYAGGSLQVQIGASLSSQITKNGTYSVVLTPTPSGFFQFNGNNFSGVLSAVSVKEVSIIKPSLSVQDSSSTVGLELRVSASGTNAFVGVATGQSTLSSGTGNAGFGSYALQSNTSGGINTAVGYTALQNNTVGSANTAIGAAALLSNISGQNNSGLGYGALRLNVTGSDNTALGYQALTANTTGDFNTATGNMTLFSNTTGSSNTAYGQRALFSNTTGSSNTGLGEGTLYNNTTGSKNVAVGTYAQIYGSNGFYNTSIGYLAGSYAENSNQFVSLANISNSTAIGANAQVFASNVVALGGQNSDKVKVGIGTGLPSNTLSVEPWRTSSGYVTTDGSTTVTGGAFNADMVGNIIYIATGSSTTAPHKRLITGYNSPTSITVDAGVPALTSTPYYVNYPGLQVTEYGNVGIGTLSPLALLDIRGDALFRNRSDTTTAFQIQNANAVNVFNIDTTNGELQVGSYNGGTNPVNGKITFNNSTNANTVGIVAGATSTSYNLTLPLTVGSANDCLKNSGTAGILQFGSCGAGGSSTLQGAYDAGSAGDQVIALSSANDSLIFRNPASSGTDSNQVLTVEQLNTGLLDALVVNNAGTGNILNLKDNGTTVLKVTDGGNITALGASTGTTGTTEATARTNVTTVTLTAAGGFANNDIIFINNAGQDYYTRIVSGGGTTTLSVSPEVSYDASATVTKYNLQNIGATSTDYTTQSNRFFQGYFLGGVVTGAGSTTLSDGSIISTNGLKLQSANGTVVKNTVNSTTAFQVQKADGVNLLSVDSTNSVVRIGQYVAPVTTPTTFSDSYTTTPSGTLINNASYVSGQYVELNNGGNQNGAVDYTPTGITNFDVSFEFWTSGGADAVYYYVANNSVPTTEGAATGGYSFYYSEYNSRIALNFNGTDLATNSTSGFNDSNWHTARIVRVGNNFKIYLDGIEKINYTDGNRVLNGTHWGLGGRSGGTSGTHRVRNYTLQYDVITPGTTPSAEINTATGATVFQTGTNSSTGFQIQDASGATIFNVDTITRSVGINTTTPNAPLHVGPSTNPAPFNFGFESGTLGLFSSTTPTYQWAVGTTTVHNGVYAAYANNNAGYGQLATLKIVRTIPAGGSTLSWWRYHSGCTEIKLYIDGVLANNDACSNQNSWVMDSVPIGSGTHTFEWRADFNGKSSGDAVYIDDVSFASVIDSANTAIFEGNVAFGTTTPASHVVDVYAANTPTSWLSVQNGAGLQGGLLINENKVYGIQAAAQNTDTTNGGLLFDYRNMSDGSVAQANILSVNGTGNVGIGTASPTAVLQVAPSSSNFVQDFESADIAPMTSVGTYVWAPTNTRSHNGGYSALATNAPGLNQVAELEITKTLSATGTVTFWVYHEGGTALEYYVDNVLVNNDNAGFQGTWHKYTFTLASGTHTLKWRADFTGKSSGDKVFIDDIMVTNAGATAAFSVTGGYSGFGTSIPTATLDVRGSTLFKSTVNSTSMFDIQNASGTSFFTADSTNLRVTVTNLVVTASLTVNGHIISGNSSGTTTVAAGVAACTSPTVSVAGNDTAGVITVTTGTGCSAGGTLATVTFANAFTTAPVVTVTPQDSASAGLQTYATQGTGTFVLGTNTTAANTTTYKFNYHTIQ